MTDQERDLLLRMADALSRLLVLVDPRGSHEDDPAGLGAAAEAVRASTPRD